MQFYSALAIATLALVSAAPVELYDKPQTIMGMTGFQNSMTNNRQVMDTLNRQLHENAGHANAAVLSAFITGADSQIDNAIATVSEALAPLTGGLSMAVGDALLGPFVQSVTNGAEVFLSNLIGGAADLVDDSMAAMITGDYSKLTKVASKYNVDTSKLQNLNQQITQTVSGKSKRATGFDLAGFHGSMVNYQETQDTLNRQLKAHNGHAAQAVINDFITGADSQIDNAIATISDVLAPVTLGLSKDVGNFLLGPFVQAVTNGAEVLISNLIGGGIDLVSDGAVHYIQNLQTLSKTAAKHNVAPSTVDALTKVQQQLSNAIAKH